MESHFVFLPLWWTLLPCGKRIHQAFISGVRHSLDEAFQIASSYLVEQSMCVASAEKLDYPNHLTQFYHLKGTWCPSDENSPVTCHKLTNPFKTTNICQTDHLCSCWGRTSGSFEADTQVFNCRTTFFLIVVIAPDANQQSNWPCRVHSCNAHFFYTAEQQRFIPDRLEEVQVVWAVVRNVNMTTFFQLIQSNAGISVSIFHAPFSPAMKVFLAKVYGLHRLNVDAKGQERIVKSCQ